MIEDSLGCCGIGSLYELSRDPEENLNDVLNDGFDETVVDGKKVRTCQYGLIIFSDNVKTKNGSRLAAFIRKHRLGPVSASPVVVNPKHRSKIRLWTWRINGEALIRWDKRTHPEYYPENSLDFQEEIC